MNVPAMIGAGTVQVGLAAIMVMSASSATTFALCMSCLPELDYWECLGVEKPSSHPADYRPTTVFLHVPVLDSASEIIPTPTGKGAAR